MLNILEIIGICLIVSVCFTSWLTRKTNMKFIQGMILFIVSGPGTLCLILFVDHFIFKLDILKVFIVGPFSVISFCVLTLAFRFYRDPDRKVCDDDNLIISPADGRIIYIREIKKGEIPISYKGRSKIELKELVKTDVLKEDGFLIGIMMTLWDVHVNRAPISGKIIFNKHSPGKFLSLKDGNALTANERNVMLFKGESILVGIVQIASKQVRRIVSYISEGDNVEMGQRVGAILLGSQVDLIMMKKRCEILVNEGQQVYAGETPLIRLEETR